MSEWVSVKERLPEMDRGVIAQTHDGLTRTAWRDTYRVWHSSETDAFLDVSLWMPIPPPPESPVRTALRLAKHAIDFVGWGKRMSPAEWEATESAKVAISRAEAELDAKCDIGCSFNESGADIDFRIESA